MSAGRRGGRVLAKNEGIVRLVELPSGERPRERLLSEGPRSLRDAELIAVILRTGSGAKDAVALARTLLERFGGVLGVLNQDAPSLLSVTGLGDAKVAALLAIRELLERAELAVVKDSPLLSGSRAVRRYLGLRLADQEREVFGVLLLDTRHQLLAVEELFFGSVDRAAVYPREIVKCCLRHNASAAILFHNHPSGVPEPSATDLELTKRLASILGEIDVRLLDHVVVGGMQQVSMAEQGLL